jgi:hypothetical protein
MRREVGMKAYCRCGDNEGRNRCDSGEKQTLVLLSECLPAARHSIVCGKEGRSLGAAVEVIVANAANTVVYARARVVNVD